MKKLKTVLSFVVIFVFIAEALAVLASDDKGVRYNLTAVRAAAQNANISVEQDANKEKFVYISPTGNDAFGEFVIDGISDGTYDISLEVKGGPGRGVYLPSINGADAENEIDLYSKNVYTYETNLGSFEIYGGTAKVRFTYRGKTQDSIAGAFCVRNITFKKITENESADYDSVDRKIKSEVYTHPVKDRTALEAEKQLYVDPVSGNDKNDGSIDQPFKSIFAAKEAVRQINQNMSGDIVVVLRGGTYYPELTEYEEELYSPGEGDVPVLRETRIVKKSNLDFNEADSGSNGFYVIYKAYENETPVISGETVITDWELFDK